MEVLVFYIAVLFIILAVLAAIEETKLGDKIFKKLIYYMTKKDE